MAIKKDTLHPESEVGVDIYPKTSIDQVENLQANLDALNGDIANANGEIANISTNVENITNKVGDINKDVSTLKYNDTNQDRRIQVLENTSGTTINRVEIAEKNITDLQNDVNQNIIDISDIKDDITVLNTAYGSYTDYTEVTNGFLLTYLSGKQIELPIKAGTNVTFSKYPGSNQIIINSTGGSVPDNIALLDANNIFSGSNTFSRFTYFNNYSVGIGYKDTSTGIIKTVISTNSNGAQLVLGGNYTGLTLATNTRPFVYENNTLKKIAYVSDIPTRPQYLQGSGMETPTDFSFEIGIYHTLTITLIDSYKSTSIIIPNDYDGSQIDLDIDGDYFVVTLEDEKLSVKNNTSNRSWVGKLE